MSDIIADSSPFELISLANDVQNHLKVIHGWYGGFKGLVKTFVCSVIGKCNSCQLGNIDAQISNQNGNSTGQCYMYPVQWKRVMQRAEWAYLYLLTLDRLLPKEHSLHCYFFCRVFYYFITFWIFLFAHCFDLFFGYFCFCFCFCFSNK